MQPSSAESYNTGLGVPIKWSDQSFHIKDFALKHAVPNIVKVTKGQYRNIGVSKSVCSELYLHSVSTISKVLAESVKVKEGKNNKMVVSDQKYSLPVTYRGWFELLSQDGKAVKAIRSVQELARYFPASCLVRENTKAYISRGPGEHCLDRSRIVHAGEVLTLAGEVWMPVQMGRALIKQRVLKCLVSNGDEVYFGLEQKGMFSPIAGQNNISGVHNIKGLLDKFRLPIMIRLVHGVIPTKMEKGFSGVFRFVSIYSDENAFMCPLKKDCRMMPISTREAIKVAPCLNLSRLLSLSECTTIQKRCQDMMDSYTNTIHILIHLPDSSAMGKGKIDLLSAEIELNMTSSSRHGQDSVVTLSEDQALSAQIPTMSEIEEDLLFQEIEGIYQFVREGGEPPKPLVPSQASAPVRKTSVEHRHTKPAINEHIQVLNIVDSATDANIQHADPSPDYKRSKDDSSRENMTKNDTPYMGEGVYETMDRIIEQKKSKAQATGFDSPQNPSSNGSDKEKKTDLINNNVDPEPVPTRKLTPPSQPMEVVPPPSGYAITHNNYPRINQSPVDVGQGVPVSNLRQVMKSGAYQDIQRRRSMAVSPRAAIDSSDPAHKSGIAPVPPRRHFSSDDATSNGRLLNSVDPKTDTARNPIPSNKASGKVTYNTSSSSESSDSIHSPDRRLQRSVSSPYGSSQPPGVSATKHSHPPYVAVARVGNYPSQTEGTVAVNNVNNYNRSNSMDNTQNGQKLHSMYL